MHLTGKLKVVLAASSGILCIAGLTLWLLRSKIELIFINAHQKGVARSLAKWGQKDSIITNDESAIHAAEMVTYASTYYVPGEGYRGAKHFEAGLEMQRQKTIGQLASSLERYTGLAYGTNAERWAEWAHEKRGAAPPETTNEPNGAANRSQPARSETNQKSSKAGLGR